jgi:hypothetical protein
MPGPARQRRFLEHRDGARAHDVFFRQCPAQLAEHTACCIESACAAFAVAAEKEATRARRLLSQRVAETSVAIARKRADRPVGLHRLTTRLAAVVAFGALGIRSGYSLAWAQKPFWATREAKLGVASRVLSVTLAVPAGWMIFALLLPRTQTQDEFDVAGLGRHRQTENWLGG